MNNIRSKKTLLIEPTRPTPIEIEENHQVLAAALADVSMALNSSLHLNDVLDRILENLGRVVAYKPANIMLCDGTKARIVRSKGYDLLGTEKVMMSKVFNLDEILHAKPMLKTKQPVLSYYPHLEQNWHTLPESEWIKSHIASPIISKDEVIGFINCDSDVAGFFNKLHSNAIQIFATEAGLAIRNARLFDATTRLSSKLALLNDLTQIVLKTKTVDQIFDMLPEKLIDLLDGSNVYISRWDEETRTVKGWAATGKRKEDYIHGASDPGDPTLTAQLLDNGHSRLIEDITHSDIMSQRFHGLYQEKTLFCLPLKTEEVKLGAIIIGYSRIDQVTDEIRALGEYVAIQISTAIAKIHSLELEKRQSQKLSHANALIESLSRVSTAIKRGLDTQEVMRTIGTELELLKIHSLVTLSSKTSDGLLMAYSSIQSDLIQFAKKIKGYNSDKIEISISKVPYLQRVYDEQQAYFLEDPEDIVSQNIPPALHAISKKLLESLLVTSDTKCILAPLVVEKESIGILFLWGDGLQKIDVQAASIFGGQAAVAIENANLLQEVQRLAITDELTDVLNRRGFDEVSQREFGAAKRYSRPLSLIMMDIDRFKAINDVYGHPIGDEILVEIAARARTKIRDTDYISRYGGEEFLILLIEQKPDNAKVVAERIRKSDADQPFNTSVGKIDVTISAGVTGANSQISSISMMIKTVDKALYKSKENGRNRVTLIDKI